MPLSLFYQNLGLVGIFLASFLSHSILPLPLEPTLLVASKLFNNYFIFIFALAGAIVGSILNYYIGHKGIKFFMPKPNSKSYQKAQKLFLKYSKLSLIVFGWVPFIGDPLTVVSGAFKMNFKEFLIYSTIGKAWHLALIIIVSSYIPLPFIFPK